MKVTLDQPNLANYIFISGSMTTLPRWWTIWCSSSSSSPVNRTRTRPAKARLRRRVLDDDVVEVVDDDDDRLRTCTIHSGTNSWLENGTLHNVKSRKTSPLAMNIIDGEHLYIER